MNQLNIHVIHINYSVAGYPILVPYFEGNREQGTPMQSLPYTSIMFVVAQFTCHEASTLNFATVGLGFGFRLGFVQTKTYFWGLHEASNMGIPR